MGERIFTLVPAKQAAIVPTANRTFRVAAYCRVSCPSEEQELSLDTQVSYYTHKINSDGAWKNVGVFADTATGRNTKQRVEFKKLLAKCRIGKVDLIITKSISRFGRNSLDTIKALRELNSYDVDVYFEQENLYLSDCGAQHAIEIYCALAQYESENKSRNIKWGIQHGFREGTSGYQNFSCYGYCFDKAKQTLVIVPKEATIVRLIFNLRLKGLSYGMISAELAEKRIPSPTGKTVWNRECIRKMLCNEKYAGSVLLQKTYVEDFFTGKQKKNNGQKERYYYKNNHEAIVPLEIFERVQGI